MSGQLFSSQMAHGKEFLNLEDLRFTRLYLQCGVGVDV